MTKSYYRWLSLWLHHKIGKKKKKNIDHAWVYFNPILHANALLFTHTPCNSWPLKNAEVLRSNDIFSYFLVLNVEVLRSVLVIFSNFNLWFWMLNVMVEFCKIIDLLFKNNVVVVVIGGQCLDWSLLGQQGLCRMVPFTLVDLWSDIHNCDWELQFHRRVPSRLSGHKCEVWWCFLWSLLWAWWIGYLQCICAFLQRPIQQLCEEPYEIGKL